MPTEDPSARREFFRVAVPEAEFVTLKTDSADYRVVEVSERGIRFESNAAFDVGQWVRGTITYDHDKSFAVTGKVLRIEPVDGSDRMVVVAEARNLSMPKVISFQSYLVRTYAKSEPAANA